MDKTGCAYTEIINPDDEFWSNNLAKAYTRAILPELVGRFYLHPPKFLPSNTVISNQVNDEEDNVDEPHYCYCQGPEEGDVVGCDNPGTFPKTRQWYCPDCRKLHQ